MHASVVYNPPENAPAGMKFKRNNQEFINNFFIDTVARSFTNLTEMQ